MIYSNLPLHIYCSSFPIILKLHWLGIIRTKVPFIWRVPVWESWVYCHRVTCSLSHMLVIKTYLPKIETEFEHDQANASVTELRIPGIREWLQRSLMTAVTPVWIYCLERIRAVAGIQHVLWTLVEKRFFSPFCLLSIKLLIIIIKKMPSRVGCSCKHPQRSNRSHLFCIMN